MLISCPRKDISLREPCAGCDCGALKSWRDVPLTAGMVCDAIGRWMIDRTSLSDAIRLSAEENLK